MLIPISELKRKYGINPKGIIHCGASHGEEADAYDQIGVERVLWIEAIPEVFTKLKQNISKYPGHVAFNHCLSDVDGQEVKFNISSNDGQSSSIFDFGTHAQAHPDVTFVKQIKLKTKTLKSIMYQWGYHGYDFMNLDLQGAELLALKGADLSNIKWIYCEVNEQELYKRCPLVGQIDEYLLAEGFCRVETKWAGNTGWGDAFYVKQID